MILVLLLLFSCMTKLKKMWNSSGSSSGGINSKNNTTVCKFRCLEENLFMLWHRFDKWERTSQSEVDRMLEQVCRASGDVNWFQQP